jgi:hypothetical protein
VHWTHRLRRIKANRKSKSCGASCSMSRTFATSRLLARLHLVADALESFTPSRPALSGALRMADNSIEESQSSVLSPGLAGCDRERRLSNSGICNKQHVRGLATHTGDATADSANSLSSEEILKRSNSEEGEFVRMYAEAAMESNIYDREMAILLAETQSDLKDPGGVDKDKLREEEELANLQFMTPGKVSDQHVAPHIH